MSQQPARPVIKIATAERAVVVDTTGGTSNAARARDALDEASPGAAAHCHNDHTSGGEAFAKQRLAQGGPDDAQ